MCVHASRCPLMEGTLQCQCTAVYHQQPASCGGVCMHACMGLQCGSGSAPLRCQECVNKWDSVQQPGCCGCGREGLGRSHPAASPPLMWPSGDDGGGHARPLPLLCSCNSTLGACQGGRPRCLFASGGATAPHVGLAPPSADSVRSGRAPLLPRCILPVFIHFPPPLTPR